MRRLLLGIIAVLLICVIVYMVVKRPKWGRLSYWKAQLVESPEKVYERSSGGYDEAADIALRRVEGKHNPTPSDHHLAATIIHRNVLSQNHTPRVDVATGEIDETDRALSENRRDMFVRARGHYRSALNGLTDQEIAHGEAARAIGRRETPGAETIIDAALDFAFAGFSTLLTNDSLMAIVLTEDWDAPNAPLELIYNGGVDLDLANLADGRRHATIAGRQQAAAKIAEVQGGGQKAKTEAYLDLSQQHTSDSQNSHDSSVNAAKKAIVERLRYDQGALSRLPTLGQIAEEIRKNSATFSRDPRTQAARPVLTNKAVAVVERAKNGEISSSAGASDAEVLRRVWARAGDIRNSGKTDAMRQAAYDALVDSWEEGLEGENIQCVDGRISRMLGSLTLLDFDERNWNMRRTEQHKNDIFEMTKKLIRVEAEAAAGQKDDLELQKVGKAYLATTLAEMNAVGATDDSKEKEWMETTRGKISAAIDAHIAKLNKDTPGTIPDHLLPGIKSQALAALS
jgi:hypothetical protein